MRLELELNLDQPVISLDYRRIVLSWLKTCLTNCHDGKYYDRYFRDTVTKDYSFTVIFSGPRFEKDKIHLAGTGIKILFSASDRNKTGLIFFSAFLGMKNKKFPLADGNNMVLRTIRQMKEVLVTEPVVYFQTCLGNGLCIRQHDRDTNKDRFVTCEDTDFQKEARRVLKIQALNAGYSEEKLKDLEIEPVQCRKVLVYHYGIFVDTTVGIFKMKGDNDLLQYFYAAGMGSKHSSGFGMVRVLSQERGQMNE